MTDVEIFRLIDQYKSAAHSSNGNSSDPCTVQDLNNAVDKFAELLKKLMKQA